LYFSQLRGKIFVKLKQNKNKRLTGGLFWCIIVDVECGGVNPVLSGKGREMNGGSSSWEKRVVGNRAETL
jgi:hypothetical protein